MTDYVSLRKELYERYHDAFEKLYVSELNDQLAEKDEIITALNHTIDEQQAENESLYILIKDLERRLDHDEWLVDKYREEEDTK